MSSNSEKNNLEIPLELIPELNLKEKYLFQSVAKLNDKFEDLGEKTDEQTKLLTLILEQSKITNGRVSKAENEISIIKPEIVRMQALMNLLKNKYFWIGIGIILLILVPMLTAAFPPSDILAKLFGI